MGLEMKPSVVYSRAPIVEAVLAVKVELPGDFSLEKFRKCHHRTESDYPTLEYIQGFSGEVQFGETLKTSTSSKLEGYRFVNAEKNQAYHTTFEGFSFHRLAPYIGWEQFVTEARRLWDVFRSTAHHRGYKRLGLRYINKFDFPVPQITMEDYFRTHLQVSPDLPQVMRRFFFSLLLPLPEITAEVAIVQTAIKAHDADQTSILLDIDIGRTEDMPPGDRLWDVFRDLHDWKNRVFEACITDQARERIK